MHSEHFKREEFERAIYRCLTHGDEIGIAEKSDAGYGLTTQYFDPNNERESQLFRAATTFTAWLDTNCTDGQKALGVFNSFIARALPCGDKLNTSEERRKSHEERVEFHIADAEASTAKKIEELEESIAQDQRLLDALRAERKREQQRDAFPGEKVNHAVRAIGERVVVKATNGGRG